MCGKNHFLQILFSVFLLCTRRYAVAHLIEELRYKTKIAGSIPDDVEGFFQLTYSFQPHLGPRVDSASDRNEYQESSCG
jgi:hypothetical protein